MDSTPVECGPSVDTARRSQLAVACAHHYSRSHSGAEFAAHAAELYGATVLRRARKTEPDNGLHLSGIRQRIESIFWTLKDRLGLEAHRARTLRGLRARIASKLLAYSAGIWLNWLTGRPTRAFADLNA